MGGKGKQKISSKFSFCLMEWNAIGKLWSMQKCKSFYYYSEYNLDLTTHYKSMLVLDCTYILVDFAKINVVQ